MPELKKLLCYWGAVFCTAFGEIGTIAAIAALGGGMIGVLLGWKYGFAKPDEISTMIFIIVVSTIAGVVLEFAIRFLFITPSKINADKDAENNRLSSELKRLHDQSEIEHKQKMVEIQSRPIPTKRHPLP